MNRSTATAAIIAAILLVGALTLTACGDDDSSPGASTATATQAANGTDLAFATEMSSHHQMAIDMAEMAKEEASHQEIKTLAADIVTAQKQEITQLDDAKQRISDTGVTPVDLGLSDEESGMSMDMHELEGAEPFDRMFIDMMIPHHQGAIRMAQVELAKGGDPELKQMAQQIIDAQSKEIEQMNMWRKEWYGAKSPAGGVPDDSDMGSHMSTQEMDTETHMSTQEMDDSMDHSG